MSRNHRRRGVIEPDGGRGSNCTTRKKELKRNCEVKHIKYSILGQQPGSGLVCGAAGPLVLETFLTTADTDFLLITLIFSRSSGLADVLDTTDGPA